VAAASPRAGLAISQEQAIETTTEHARKGGEFMAVLSGCSAFRSATVGAAKHQTQVPLRQVRPALHIFPQPPQLRGSVRTSTHAPPHRLVSGPHTHAPLLQDAPLAQVWPHCPQLAGSICTSVQAPAHTCCAPGQAQRDETQA